MPDSVVMRVEGFQSLSIALDGRAHLVCEKLFVPGSINPAVLSRAESLLPNAEPAAASLPADKQGIELP
jgi:hypothetical protein